MHVSNSVYKGVFFSSKLNRRFCCQWERRNCVEIPAKTAKRTIIEITGFQGALSLLACVWKSLSVYSQHLLTQVSYRVRDNIWIHFTLQLLLSFSPKRSICPQMTTILVLNSLTIYRWLRTTVYSIYIVNGAWVNCNTTERCRTL